MCVAEDLDEYRRVILAEKASECSQVVVAEHGWDNRAHLVCGRKFGVHHDAGDPPVAVVKGVNLGDHEHGEHRALPGCVEDGKPLVR
jgi:hypothetical protein